MYLDDTYNLRKARLGLRDSGDTVTDREIDLSIKIGVARPFMHMNDRMDPGVNQSDSVAVTLVASSATYTLTVDTIPYSYVSSAAATEAEILTGLSLAVSASPAVVSSVVGTTILLESSKVFGGSYIVTGTANLSVTPVTVAVAASTIETTVLKSTVNTTPVAGLRPNTLHDNLDTTRFVYLGMAVSSMTNNTVEFYYDDKYKDIIIVPELNLIGTDAMALIHNKTTIPITAEVASITIPKSVINYTPKFSVNEELRAELQVIPVKQSSTTTILKDVRTFEPDRAIAEFMIPTSKGDLNMYKHVPEQFVSLGLTSDVFPTTVKVSFLNLYLETLSTHGVTRHSNRIPFEILIPLYF